MARKNLGGAVLGAIEHSITFGELALIAISRMQRCGRCASAIMNPGIDRTPLAEHGSV